MSGTDGGKAKSILELNITGDGEKSAKQVESNVTEVIESIKRVYAVIGDLFNQIEEKQSEKSIEYFRELSESVNYFSESVQSAANLFSAHPNADFANEFYTLFNALESFGKLNIDNFDMSNYFSNFDELEKLYKRASSMTQSYVKDAYNKDSFEGIFNLIGNLNNLGFSIEEVDSLLHRIGSDTSSIDYYKDRIKELENEVSKLEIDLEDAQFELDDYASGEKVAALNAQIERLNSTIETLRRGTRAGSDQFSGFLNSIGILGVDSTPDGKYKEFFTDILSGAKTAEQAIQDFSKEYRELVIGAINNGKIDVSNLEQFKDLFSSLTKDIKNSLGDNIGLSAIGDGSLTIAQESIDRIKEAVKSLANEIGVESQPILESIAAIVSALSSLSEHGDNANYSVAKIIESLSNFKVSKAGVNNLNELKTAISDMSSGLNLSKIRELSSIKFDNIASLKGKSTSINNISKGFESLSAINPAQLKDVASVDFSKYSNLKVKKTSLESLTTYLYALSELDADPLIRLSNIDFSNLSNINDSGVLDALKGISAADSSSMISEITNKLTETQSVLLSKMNNLSSISNKGNSVKDTTVIALLKDQAKEAINVVSQLESLLNNLAFDNKGLVQAGVSAGLSWDEVTGTVANARTEIDKLSAQAKAFKSESKLDTVNEKLTLLKDKLSNLLNIYIDYANSNKGRKFRNYELIDVEQPDTSKFDEAVKAVESYRKAISDAALAEEKNREIANDSLSNNKQAEIVEQQTLNEEIAKTNELRKEEAAKVEENVLLATKTISDNNISGNDASSIKQISNSLNKLSSFSSPGFTSFANEINNINKDNISVLSNFIKSDLGNFPDLTEKAKSIEALTESIKNLFIKKESTDNNEAIIGRLTNIDFSNFSNLPYDMPGLEQLLSILAAMTQLDVATLEKISNIDFSTLSNFKFNTNSISSIAEFTKALQELVVSLTNVSSAQKQSVPITSTDVLNQYKDSITSVSKLATDSDVITEIQDAINKTGVINTSNIDDLINRIRDIGVVITDVKYKTKEGIGTVTDGAKELINIAISGANEAGDKIVYTLRHIQTEEKLDKDGNVKQEAQDYWRVIQDTKVAVQQLKKALSETDPYYKELSANQKTLSSLHQSLAKDSINAGNYADHEAEINVVDNLIVELNKLISAYDNLNGKDDPALRTNIEQLQENIRQKIISIKEELRAEEDAAKERKRIADENERNAKRINSQLVTQAYSSINKNQGSLYSQISSLKSTVVNSEDSNINVLIADIQTLEQRYESLGRKIVESKSSSNALSDDVINSIKSEQSAIDSVIQSIRNKIRALNDTRTAQEKTASSAIKSQGKDAISQYNSAYKRLSKDSLIQKGTAKTETEQKLSQLKTLYDSLAEAEAKWNEEGKKANTESAKAYEEKAAALQKYAKGLNDEYVKLQAEIDANEEIERNTKAIAAARKTLEKYSAAEDNAETSETYKNLKEHINQLENLNETRREGVGDINEFAAASSNLRRQMTQEKSVIETSSSAYMKLGDQVLRTVRQYAQFYLGTRTVLTAVRYFKQMISTAIELEGAFAQLKIVTKSSDAEMEKFADTAANLASSLGQSITDIAKTLETFSRLGYSLSESTKLAEAATIMANVGDVETDDATTGITAIVKGYNKGVEDVEHITDVLIEVGQKYAVSASELMEAYEKCGAALNATNTSLEKSAGLIAAANASIQNAAVVGTALKTMSARIRGSKSDLEELGEDTDELANGFSKYAEELKALTGFNIMVEGTTDQFKDLYDIMEGIAGVWDQLTDTQQARVSEILGGTRQLQVVSSIITNWEDAAGAYEDATNSAGAAAEANEIALSTTEAHVNMLKASFQDLSSSLVDETALKALVDFAKVIVDIVNAVAKVIEPIHGTTLLILWLGSSALTAASKTEKFVVVMEKLKKLLSADSLKALFSLKSLGILAAVVGISAAISAFDSLAHAQEKAAQKADESIQNYKESANKLEEISNQIEETKKRYNELLAISENRSLTFVEQDEINKLRETNTELEIQKKLEEDIQKIEQDKANKNLEKAYSKERYTFDPISELFSMEKSTGGEKAFYGEMNIEQYYSTLLRNFENLGKQKQQLDYLIINDSGVTEKVRKDAQIITEEYNGTSDALKSLANNLKENYIDKYIGSGEMKESWESMYEGIVKAVYPAEYFVDQLNSLPEEAINTIKQYGASASLTAAKVEELAQEYPELNAWMEKSGYVAQDVATYYNVMAKNASLASNNIQELSNLSETLSSLKSGYDVLNTAQEEMISTGSISADTINSLAGITDNYIDYLYMEGDAVKLNVEKWKEYINTSPQADIESLKATIESLSNAAGDNSEAIAEAEQKLAIYETLYDSISHISNPFDEAVSGFSSVANAIDTVTGKFETLANLQNAVSDSFTMSVDDALEYAKVYPEILNNAQVAADGQITLNSDVVNDFISGKQAELQSDIDAKIAELEGQKSVLQAKKAFAEAQLNMAKQVAEGSANISLEEAQYRIDVGNAMVQALVDMGVDEAEAYRLATNAMTMNAQDFNSYVATASENVANNLSGAAVEAANKFYENMYNVQKSINAVTAQAHEAARAVGGIASGNVRGSTNLAGGRAAGTSISGFTAYTDTATGNGHTYQYTAKKIDLQKYISQLSLDISNYTAAISQIDGQIAVLKSLRSKSLDQYISNGSSGSGGGSGGSGSGSGGGSSSDSASNWFEEQYKLHKHLIAMDAEEVDDFLEWLNSAYKQAYKEGIIDLNDYYQYQEEVYSGLQDLFKDYLNDIEHEISMRENYDYENQKILELYRNMLEAVEKEIADARARGLDDTDDYIQELQDKWQGYKDAITDIEEEVNTNVKDSVDELVDIRVKMLKQGLEDEKDQLDERLDYLKDFYDKQKELLQDAYDEEKYLEEQTEKRKAVADIEAELAQLQYDNSAWAQKRRLELEQELADAQSDLNDFERDHALEVAQDELDKLYESQEEELDNEIDLLEEKLNDEQALYEQALEDIRNGSQELYEEMMQWALDMGEMTQDEVTEKWEAAYKALEEYRRLFGELYEDIQLYNATGYIPEGWDEQPVAGGGSGSGSGSGGSGNSGGNSGSGNSGSSGSSGNTSHPSLSRGSTITVKRSATHFSANSGGVSMASFVPGGTYTVYETDGNQVLIGKNGVYTGWINRNDIVGYARGTKNAMRGLHAIDEEGLETIFESKDGTRYKMFTGGEKVLNARASKFLYDFAMSKGGILKALFKDSFAAKPPVYEITPVISPQTITGGDIIINGNADEKTVSQIRRAQRDNLKTMLKEFNKLNRNNNN